MNKQISTPNSYPKHLKSEEIALVVDALIYDKLKLLNNSILEHIEECQQCKQEIMHTYELIYSDINSLKYRKHPFFGNIKKTFSVKMHQKSAFLLKLAAISVLVLGVAGLLYTFIQSQKARPNTELARIENNEKSKDLLASSPINVKSEVTNQVKKTNSALYKESDFFENLITVEYRGNDVEVLAPALKQEYQKSDRVEFQFKGDLSTPVSIFIYTNTGKKVLEQENIQSTAFTLGNQLSPGLYYWKIIRDDNLMKVGKFLIK
jgi:hypothetical protein